MGYFSHGHIQWKSLESTGEEDQHFLFLIQDSSKSVYANVRNKQGWSTRSQCWKYNITRFFLIAEDQI